MRKRENKLNAAVLRKIFFAACLTAGLFNLSCSPISTSPLNEPTRNIVNELKEVCRNLPAIPDATVVNNEESKQTNAIVYTTVYESAAQPEDVEPLFLNLLTKQGWQSSTEQTAEDVTSVKFRKDNFTVSLEYFKYQFLQNNKYTVKCAWEAKQ